MYFINSKIAVFCTLLFAGIFAGGRQAYATDSLCSKIIVDNIQVSGNNKTKEAVILREVRICKGMQINITALETLLLDAKKQLINTSLFLNVALHFKKITDSTITIFITVKERWYIFPAPVFSFADHNFNVWWSQQMRSLHRLNYGLALDYRNVTGHNDNLDIGFQTGYTHSFGIFYNRPNIGRRQQHEVGVQFIKGKNREVNYASMFNKKSFFKLNGFIRHHTEGNLYYSYRKNIYTKHYFSIGFMKEVVADTVAKLHPNYLGKGNKELTYPEFIYRYTSTNTNNLQYPLTGKSFLAELLLNGFGGGNGISITQLKTELGLYYKLYSNTYFNANISGKFFLPVRQPFVRFRGLGYNDKEFFRGLDNYVLDGNAYGVIKTNFKKELLLKKSSQKAAQKGLRKIPLQLFAKVIMDAGYVSNQHPGNNTLVNRWLFTKGAGVDMVSFYDINVSIEYIFNQWKESGLFFRIRLRL